MGFAAPLALLGLVLLAVPVAIHLYPRRTRQPLRVGSVRHLAGAAPARRSGLRVTEPALLAARLAIVALLVLTLAEPFRSRVRTGGARKVALVAAAFTPAPAGSAARRITDSLEAAGFDLRGLDSLADVWQALRAVDATLPPGSAIALVAPGRVRAGGARPAVSSDVSVHLLPHASDSTPRPAPRIVPVHRRVTIASAPARRGDARLLAAAFRAIAEHRGDTLELREVGTASMPEAAVRGDGAGAWLVWLPDSSARALPSDATRRDMHLLTDGGPASGPRLALRRDAGALTVTLAGRFSADSTDLMLTGALPELLAGIWPEPLARTLADPTPRPVSASQLRPDRAAPQRRGGNRAPIGAPLFALAALLFLAERWMAHRAIPGGGTDVRET